MKNFKNSIVFVLALGVLFSGLLLAEEGLKERTENGLQKPTIAATGTFDGNRIDNDFENNGMIVSHNISGRSGMSWPVGNNSQTVFASGIWVGGLIGNIPHVTAGEYAGEFVGGPWGSDPNDPQHTMYKVNKSDLADPLANPHFQNWPTDFGAPWVDNNGNGTYEPLPNGPDHPEFIGDQVVYLVMNDGDPTAHSNVFNTNPLGLEMQMTVFGFDRPDAFGDMMFVKALLINKGEEDIVDTYIGLWSDPDLGDAGDDFVGCVPEIGLGICYNDGEDDVFAGYAGGTPAVGYDFFQGPIVPAPGETALVSGVEVPDYRNLSMTSFTKYINTNDPVWSDPNSADEAYNLMKGLMKDGSNFANNLTGGTTFVHPGDPNLDTGPTDDVYVDSDIHASGDRRFLMNAGPFTMAVGDEQEVVFAIFHAAAGDALDSYNYLIEVDKIAQLAYDTQFALPPSPPSPTVEVTEFANEILMSWDAAAESYTAEDVIDKDPVTGENTAYTFEGYNVWQFETVSGSGSKKLIATYDMANGITEIYDDVFDANFGETINRRVQFGTDSGIKRSLSITSDALNNGAPLKTNRTYYFSVNSYGYNPFGIPVSLESSDNIMAIRPQIPNTWEAGDETASSGAQIAATHDGPSDGSASATVINAANLTGDDYEIFFAEENYYQDISGVWHNADAAGKRGLGKVLDCTGSMITFTASLGAGGSYDLLFNLDMHCGSNWVDGIMIQFPSNVTVNEWDPLGLDPSYGSGAGQNCGNMDGTLDAGTNTITWGDDARTGFGCIEGSVTWVVNIQPTDLPFSVDYSIYDDGYDGTIVDVAAATELSIAEMAIFGWYAKNASTNEVITPHTTIQSGQASDNIVNGKFIPAHTAGADANPIAEGIQFVVNGPSNGIHGVWQTANANGPIAGVDEDVNENVLWINFLTAPDFPTEQAQGGWAFVTHGGGTPNDWDSFYARVFRGSNFDRAIPFDFEMRFTQDARDNGMGYRRFEDGLLMENVPFELWNATLGYRMLPAILNGVGLGAAEDDFDAFDLWGDDASSSADNDPSSDWVYWGNPDDMSPGQAGYDTWIAPGVGNGPDGGWTEVIARTRIMNWNRFLGGGGGALDPEPAELALPEVGTVLRWITNKPNDVADSYSLTTAGLTGNAVAYDPDAINVWPNPYFGYNPEERDPIDQIVNFTHLPETGNCTIRIFNLAGVPVRTINHAEGTQFEQWDLKNNFRIPVASGMYVVVVETDSGSKVLKLAIIQPEQRLDVY